MELTQSLIQKWIAEKLTERMQIPADSISLDKDFAEYGIDSLNAVGLVGEIEQWIGHELPATALWDHTSIRKLADFVLKRTKAVSN